MEQRCLSWRCLRWFWVRTVHVGEPAVRFELAKTDRMSFSDDISEDDLQELSRASLQRPAADPSYDGRPMDQSLAQVGVGNGDAVWRSLRSLTFALLTPPPRSWKPSSWAPLSSVSLWSGEARPSPSLRSTTWDTGSCRTRLSWRRSSAGARHPSHLVFWDAILCVVSFSRVVLVGSWPLSKPLCWRCFCSNVPTAATAAFGEFSLNPAPARLSSARVPHADISSHRCCAAKCWPPAWRC